MVDSTYDKFFLYKIKPVSTNLCDLCNVPEYAKHMIFECQQLNNIRSKFKIFKYYKDLK